MGIGAHFWEILDPPLNARLIYPQIPEIYIYIYISNLCSVEELVLPFEAQPVSLLPS